MTISENGNAGSQRSGVIFAVASFVLWGVLPIYFLALQPASAVEVVAWRILFSIIFCVLLLTVTRKWPAFVAILRRPRTVGLMGLAALFVVINWQVYIYGTLSGHVVETALGYFINPIVTVLLGVFVLRERLRKAQWVAVGLSAVAVVVLAVNYGALPWISLTVAISFALYGLIKKRVGSRVDALSGLTLETAWLIPVACVQLVIVSAGAGITFGTISACHTLLLIGSGVITAVPLLLFAAASRRLPLVYLGLVQYLTPVLQFVFGVFVLHETMPPVRWAGFAIVWVALIVLSIDLLIAGRRARRTTRVV